MEAKWYEEFVFEILTLERRAGSGGRDEGVIVTLEESTSGETVRAQTEITPKSAWPGQRFTLRPCGEDEC